MPQKIAIVLHAAPYGSERCLSALRIANMLAAHDAQPEVTVFLMSDATVLALPGQNDGQGGQGLQSHLQILIEAGATVRVCRTCAQNRGLLELPLLPGTAIGNLTELTDWTMAADKVLTF